MTRELFKFQNEGVKFLVNNNKCILADSMGLGKTVQAITAAGQVSEKSILVICPASLKINWEREIHIVYDEDEVITIDSGQQKEIDNKYSWIIINYDMLPKYEEQLIRKVEKEEIDTVIIDEAHYIKGKGTARAESTLKITEKAKRVYCLTGTPIMNRPSELFNVLRAIKHPLSKVRSIYVKLYCGGQLKTLVRDITTGKTFFVMPQKAFPFRMNKKKFRVFTFVDDTGATRLPQLYKNIQSVILRRTKKEVLDLPEKIISVQVCEFDNEYKKKYDSAWDEYVEWVSNNPEGKNIDNIIGAQQIIETGKLKQVCSHAKINTIVEDVKNAVDQGEKVIIFSQYTGTIKELEKKIGKGCVTLTGQDDMESRQKSVDAFQNDTETKVFIANIKAGGVGINLTRASIVIFADMDWSPEIHSQAEDRAHRIGTTGTVNVYYYVVKDTIEEEIVKMLQEKKGIIQEVMEGKRKKTEIGSIIKDIIKTLNKKVANSYEQ